MDPMDPTVQPPPEGENQLESMGGGQEPAPQDLPPWAAQNIGKLDDLNLVPLIEKMPDGPKWLEDGVNKWTKEKDSDQQSAKGYHDRTASALELYLLRSEDFKSGPAEGERRPALPILAKIVNRTYARTMGVVLRTEPIAVPTGDDDYERVMRVSQHISWEKRYRHPDWAPGMAASVLQWNLFGSMFRYTGWDPLENKKAIEWMGSDELVVPYQDKDPDPRMSHVERMTRLTNIPKWKLKRLGKVGHYHGVDKLFDKNADRKPSPVSKTDPKSMTAIKEVVNAQQGVSPSSMEKGTEYRLCTRYSWEELPGDEETGPRRLKIVWEESTKRVLRIVIMEEEDKLDRLRFDNEVRLATIQAANQGMDPAQATAAVRPPATRPVFDIIHYVFQPNPEGFYGLGAWSFVGSLNELANELAGEDLVGQRLANVSQSTGLISNDLEMEKGKIKIKYGEYTGVNVPVGGLQGSIMPLAFDRPRGNILGWLEKIDEEAQAVMSSSDYQSGMPGPSHETAAAAKLRVSEGMTNITAALESFLIPLAIEYKNYARLNALYMSEFEYFMVVDADPSNTSSSARPQQKKIFRTDYEADFNITFDSDARYEIDPGMGNSALQAYQMIMADPDMQGDANIRMAARKKALKALKAQDLAMMLPDSVPPPPPPEPMSQEDENAGFMTEKDHPVLEDDDHHDHLVKMGEFEHHGLTKDMSSTGKQLFERHRRAHQAQAYLLATKLIRPALMAPVAPDAGGLSGNNPNGSVPLPNVNVPGPNGPV